MTKDLCSIVKCRGCLPMLVETIAFLSAFAAIVLAVVYPLISG